MAKQIFSLTWEAYNSQFACSLQKLFSDNILSDVTLVSDDNIRFQTFMDVDVSLQMNEKIKPRGDFVK